MLIKVFFLEFYMLWEFHMLSFDETEIAFEPLSLMSTVIRSGAISHHHKFFGYMYDAFGYMVHDMNIERARITFQSSFHRINNIVIYSTSTFGE